MHQSSSGKDVVEKIAATSGAKIGAAAGGAVASAGAAAVSAAAAATAQSAAIAASPVVAAVAAAPLNAGAATLATPVVFHPATWAVLATNPIGHVVLIAGAATLGAFALYKLIKNLD